MTNRAIYFVLLFLFPLLSFANNQSITKIPYKPLQNFSKNKYFQAVNSKMITSYPSYLTNSTVKNVKMYSTALIIYFQIYYILRSGVQFRGTTQLNINTKQLNISSFGPIANLKSFNVPKSNDFIIESTVGLNSSISQNNQSKIATSINPQRQLKQFRTNEQRDNQSQPKHEVINLGGFQIVGKKRS